MDCPLCGSKSHKNGFENGIQKYHCTNELCTKRNFTDNTNPLSGVVKSKVGMSLNEFRERHDVDYIVAKTLAKLDRNMIYEKSDICKLTGLRAGYPGLSQTIEDAKAYYGKVASTLYFSHPDTITELKEQAKLT